MEQVLNLKWDRKKGEEIISKIKSFYLDGNWFNRQDLNKNKFFFDKKKIIKKLNIDPKEKTAVIFSHIFYDATFFFGENLYFDYQEWLVETIRIAVRNKNINWILKVHPVNVWRSKMDNSKLENLEVQAIKSAFGKVPDNLTIVESNTSINTLSFIDFIDFGITVRGTIGLELSAFGKIVVTAGSGRYDGNGFTLDPRSKIEYKKILLNLHKYTSLKQRQKELAQKFFDICYFKKPFEMPKILFDYKSKSFGINELKYNLTILSKSKEDFFNNKNNKILSQWMITNSDTDILNTEEK